MLSVLPAPARRLPAPPPPLDVAASPVADGRRRVRGLLVRLGAADLARLPGVTDEIEQLARRWRGATGSKVELHCLLPPVRARSLQPSRLRQLAPEGPIERVARVTDLHLWMSSSLLDSPEVATMMWRVGASIGRLVDVGDGGRVTRGDLAIPSARLEGFVRPSRLGRTLTLDVDDDRTARASRRFGAWRMAGGVIGAAMPLDEWGWWAAGLGCRTSVHVPQPRR